MFVEATNSAASDGNAAGTGTEVENAAPLVNADAGDQGHESDELEIGDEGDGDESQSQQADDSEEIEWEGNKVRIPKVIKDGLLRHADYTRKTQELAEQRRAFEHTSRQSLADQKEYVEALANVRTLDTRLDQYKDVDWTTLEQQDPAAASQHWRIYSQLKEQRTAAEQAATGAKGKLEVETQRQRAQRADEVMQALPKHVPGFNAEMNATLTNYALKSGMSQDEVTDAVLRNPVAAKHLYQSMLYEKQQAKTATTQRLEKQQATKPAAEIGTRSTAQNRDPARMGQAAYVKWRQSQG